VGHHGSVTGCLGHNACPAFHPSRYKTCGECHVTDVHTNSSPKQYQNIFVTRKSPRWWVKLGDFGMTKRVAGESSVLHTEVGTRAFRAPEIMDPDVDSYTNAVDMWSLGCVTYMMLTSKIPFPGYSLGAFCSGREPFPSGHLLARDVSPAACGFVEKLLCPDPSTRMTASEALRTACISRAPPPSKSFPTAVSNLNRAERRFTFPANTEDPMRQYHNRWVTGELHPEPYAPRSGETAPGKLTRVLTGGRAFADIIRSTWT
jgi:serine/threonine protein kinase